MIGLVVTEDQEMYRNLATGDKWLINFEQFSIRENGRHVARLYFEARFFVPDAMQIVTIKTRPNETLAQVFQGKGETMEELRTITLADACPNINAGIRLGRKCDPSEIRAVGKQLYASLMEQIHKLDVVGEFPEIIKAAMRSGQLEY